jgi:hypothetical protein
MSDFKLAYAASVAVTITSLNSLAASSTLLSGAESTAIDNSTNLYQDYLLGGHITAGAASTQIGVIEISVVAMEDDSVWPDVFDGTDSAEAVTSAEIKRSICKVAVTLETTATASRVYSFSGISIANLFGGTCPRKFVIFVSQTAHSTTVALAATGHSIAVTGVWVTGP